MTVVNLLGASVISRNAPPSTAELGTACPKPDLVAGKRLHFGREVWHFECPLAVEVVARDRGITIKCAGLDGSCCIENGETIFVGSPEINPFKGFLETTLNYLGLK